MLHFQSPEHQQYYEQMNPKDSYQRALFYLIGLCPDTRNHTHELYGPDGVNPEALYAAWQTEESRRLTRLGFNLYTDHTPSAYRYTADDQTIPPTEDDRRECVRYSASDIFCSAYAPYFVEAIKLRYPEYFRETTAPVKVGQDQHQR